MWRYLHNIYAGELPKNKPTVLRIWYNIRKYTFPMIHDYATYAIQN